MVQGTGFCCIALLPAVLATLGIGSSILSTVWCEAIKFIPDLSNTPDFPNLSEQTRDVLANNEDGFANWKFGLYYHSQVQDIEVNTAGDTIVRVTDQCVDYADNIDFDAAWRTARAFALIAPITAGVFTLGLYMAPCCIFYNRATWNSMAVFFLFVIPALQSLTLLFLTSDACKNNPVIEDRVNQVIQSVRSSATAAAANQTTTTNTEAPAGNMTDTSNATSTDATIVETDAPADILDSDTEDALRSIYASDCVWDWGMYANLLSMILFFVTGVIMLLMGAPTRPPPKQPEIQTVTYEQKVDDAGDQVIEEVDVTTETYNPNGPSWANPNHQAPIPNNNGYTAAKPY